MAKAPQVSRFKSNPLDWSLGGAPPTVGASRSAAPLAAKSPLTPTMLADII
jgi:hypothetical protein